MKSFPLRPAVAGIAALLLLSLFFVILAQIILRLIGMPLVWSEEFASVAFIWLVFLGAALACERRENLDVDLLFNAVAKGRRMRRWEILIAALQIVFLGVLAVGSAQMADQTWKNSMGALKGFPYGGIYVGVLIGALLYLVFLIRQIVRLSRGADEGDGAGRENSLS
ncbi:TRAP transporter small permease subunit [Actibacterium sp. MT2.3-13A]|uniref:TRAP transporter small permease n=1 Tax=Actibacterium sp. MT2.3-13A TaxID=2828332 RepID=UPI001BA4F901|nr:TRAP transporter small permease subunit [Actibacterium sp. MT2.3-13A]